jgi:hypothetical protein
MVGFGGIEKLIINFAVIFIVATIAAGVLPGTANKLFAATKDKLGFADPNIVSFSAVQSAPGTINVRYTILGDYSKIGKIDISYKFSYDGNFEGKERNYITVEPSLSKNIASILGKANPKGTMEGSVYVSESRGWYRFTVEVRLMDGETPNTDATIRVGVPVELGDADATGVYSYSAQKSTPLYYRFTADSWQWTPYYPVWMPSSTTIVNNPYNTKHKWHGKEPSKDNLVVISYLANYNPQPSQTENGVPAELGLPDSEGIYKYVAPSATPIWYRYVSNAWQWTPYYPVWMPATTTIVNNIYDPNDEYADGKWNGKEPSKVNIEIINYLAAVNPSP